MEKLIRWEKYGIIYRREGKIEETENKAKQFNGRTHNITIFF